MNCLRRTSTTSPTSTEDTNLRYSQTSVGGAPMMIGEARYVLAPDRLECEFALSVADDWRSKGLSTLLMADIECRARSIGARHLGRDILRSNEPMKALARKNGFPWPMCLATPGRSAS